MALRDWGHMVRRFAYQALFEPEEDGGYSITVPDLPGCYSCGDDFNDAVYMAADALKCFVGVMLYEGKVIPEPTEQPCPEGWKSVFISFEIDEENNEWKPCVSAAEAARRLGVSRGRVSRLLRAGILEGSSDWGNIFVTEESIERRLASNPKPGRPRKKKAEMPVADSIPSTAPAPTMAASQTGVIA